MTRTALACPQPDDEPAGLWLWSRGVWTYYVRSGRRMAQEAAVPRDLWQEIEKMIDRKIARYARSGPLRSSAISEGGLTIKGGTLQVKFPDSHGGETAVFFGDLWSTVDGSYLGTGLLIQAEDGTDIASFSTNAPAGTTTAHLHDGGNRIIVANDGNSGMGLARPYIPGGFYRADFADWVTVTGTSFVTKFRARLPKQHPKLYVRAWASNDTSGATGEVRLLVNGVPWGPTQATAFSITEYVWGPLAVDGDHMSDLVVELQARVVSGSGGVRLEPSRLEGQQS